MLAFPVAAGSKRGKLQVTERSLPLFFSRLSGRVLSRIFGIQKSPMKPNADPALMRAPDGGSRLAVSESGRS